MPEKPFNKEDIESLDKAIAVLKEVNTAIARAKMAGLDVSAQEERSKQLEARLLALKRTYGTP